MSISNDLQHRKVVQVDEAEYNAHQPPGQFLKEQGPEHVPFSAKQVVDSYHAQWQTDGLYLREA